MLCEQNPKAILFSSLVIHVVFLAFCLLLYLLIIFIYFSYKFSIVQKVAGCLFVKVSSLISVSLSVASSHLSFIASLCSFNFRLNKFLVFGSLRCLQFKNLPQHRASE